MDQRLARRQRVLGPVLGGLLVLLAVFTVPLGWIVWVLLMAVAATGVLTVLLLRRPLPAATVERKPWATTLVIVAALAAYVVAGMLPDGVLGLALAAAGGWFVALGIRAARHPALG